MNQIKLLGSFCLFSFVVGCNSNLVGTWKSESVVPAEAAKHFNIAEAKFDRDNTFSVTSKYGDEVKTSTGTYKFDGFNLNLTTTDGKTLKYGCTHIMMGPKLEVRRSHEGQTVKVTLRKDS
jgi:hypothetical protein